ncbi:glycoside hydrolase family 25 protein [Hymenobacter cheonanensis]|uniref:glycoside hydrolase family 25 protein n=1 Tax=Hymenobacter sp. CA2-7 TaxID=3063993 RepID=UPI0027136090|nr:glycoside hydrolase family 25 protein [Hymenobacter sp. CA2-7]MDO7883979.1 glycoside hydrolase family 25 protein [Hymenobacter sp. CA2-7]
MSILGAIADISHYNHNPESPHQALDFRRAYQYGLRGVFHKATQGLGYTDSHYASRKQQALQAGLLWGAYHFGVKADGAAQAAHFLDKVRPGPHDLLVLDFELNADSDSMTTPQAEQFVQHIYKATGRYPGLYSSPYFLQQRRAGGSAILRKCWLWLAYYRDVAAPPLPLGWPYWTMWQYTNGSGKQGSELHIIPGIGPCDGDRFNGTSDGLLRLWSHEAAPSQAALSAGSAFGHGATAPAPGPAPRQLAEPITPAARPILGVSAAHVQALKTELPKLLTTVAAGLPVSMGIRHLAILPVPSIHAALTQLLSPSYHSLLLHGLVIVGCYIARLAATSFMQYLQAATPQPA